MEEITNEQASTMHDEAYSSAPERGIQDEQVNTPVDPEFEINWKGETKKLPLSKIKDLAQQGYDYSQKMSEFNKQKLAAEQAKKEFDERYSRYNEMDKYVSENPTWWDHVNQQYQNKGQTLGVAPSTATELTNNPEMMEVFESLKNEVQGLKSFKDSVEQEKAKDMQQKDDQKYQEDLAGLQKMYPTVDFSAPDESGMSLEYNVLKHANDNGIKSFRTAFLDFYHDNLMKMAESKAKETFAKDSQQIKKLGISFNNEPSGKKTTQAKSVRNSSYEDLTREALEELGIR